MTYSSINFVEVSVHVIVMPENRESNMYTMTWRREKAKHLKYVIKIELSLINHEILVVSCTGRKFC
jgi:hypothetical protein